MNWSWSLSWWTIVVIVTASHGLILPFGSHATAMAAEPLKSTANSEDAKLNAFFETHLERVFQEEPLSATLQGDHRFDDRLDDLSPAARARRVERDRDTLARLPQAVDKAQLSRDGQIDYEIFEHSLRYGIWLQEHFRPFEEDPRTWGDYISNSIYVLLTQSTLPREKNLANATARMASIPKVIATAQSTIGQAPKVKVETAIRQTQGAIGFYESELFTLAGVPKGQGVLGERAAAIVEKLKGYLGFLEGTVLPRAKDNWRIGKELFEEKLVQELDAGLTADEVKKEAEAEATRVEREMYVIGRQLWYQAMPGKPLPPDDPSGRRATIRVALDYAARDHGSPTTLLADTRATVVAIKEFIRVKNILRLPEPDQCKIIEMPEFLRGNSVAYLNPAPPLDPKGGSEYAVSPPPADWDARRVQSFLEEYNASMLKILTIHEAYPGHYVQLEYSNRHPSKIRKILSSGTFAEGWAVYTEQMMLDQGFGEGDLKLRLNQLKFYLRAVVNALLDHAMHVETLTDEQAMELLVGRAFQTEGEAVGKIIRSKQSSCQLSTYFVGRTAFYRLRQAVQREMGDRFELGPYHEAVLAHGTLPVKYLPELVRKSLGVVNP